MICLRCGYCCINYSVIIVDDPKIGPNENNLKEKRTGEKCQHLVGNVPGEYSCGIHKYDWYKETPCFQFTQIERTVDTKCRMGVYQIKKALSDETPQHQ